MNATIEQTKNNYFQWRIEKGRNRVLDVTPSIDLENAKIFTESFMETDGEPIVIRRAKAFREQCKRKTIFVLEDELIVGCSGSRIRGGIICPDQAYDVLVAEQDTISTRSQDPFAITQEDKDLLNNFIAPYWKGTSFIENWNARLPEDIKTLREHQIIYPNMRATRGTGEYAPSFEWIVYEGVEATEEKIKKSLADLRVCRDGGDSYNRYVYYNALLITCDAIKILGKRYNEYLTKLAAEESDARRKGELEKMAAMFEWIPAKPARTFWEGCQTFFLYYTCLFQEAQAPSIVPGRLDQLFYPLYKKDVEVEKNITHEQACEIFDSLWVKLGENVLFQDEETAWYSAGYDLAMNTCAGGVTSEGRDAVNPVSYMMLQAAADVRLHQPSLTVRYNQAKNPDKFLRKIVETIAVGTGFPAVYNDDCGIRAMQNHGIPLDEAYTWTPVGCTEMGLAGKTRCYTGMSYITLPQVLDLTILNGVERISGDMVTLETGDVNSFKTFEEFVEAYKKQLAYVIERTTFADHILVALAQEIRPIPVASLAYPECVERGRDYEDPKGTKYPWGDCIIGTGVADMADSLVAIKKLIYDEKYCTWDEMKAALNADFVGYEELHEKCWSCPKWGNDIDEVDLLGADLLNYFAKEIRNNQGRTGHMSAGLLPVTSNVTAGFVTGPLPSGRNGWISLADGISPYGGCDVNGPTAVVKTISKFDHALYEHGTLLNMKYSPDQIRNEKGYANLMSLIKTLCTLGCYHSQYNVLTNETLLEAQAEPKKHKGLLVRVSGYTAQFVELDKKVQDSLIDRTELKW